MILKLLEKEYELPTTLGVSYDLEKKYGKKINVLIENTNNYTIEEMCKIMHVAALRKDKSLKFDSFFNDILDSGMSALGLQKEFAVFALCLVSSDKTEDEIRAEIYKKQEEFEEERELKEDSKN